MRNRVLVILVFTDNEVQNRIIQHAPRLSTPASWSRPPTTSTPISPAGRWPRSATALLRELRDTRSEMERLLSAAVELSEQALATTGRRRHAADRPDPADGRAGPVRPGPPARAVRGLLPQARDPAAARALHHARPGVRVFIGEETGLAPLGRPAPWSPRPTAADGQVLGVLGVIGPTRMAYDRVIPMVQATADLLGRRP